MVARSRFVCTSLNRVEGYNVCKTVCDVEQLFDLQEGFVSATHEEDNKA